MTDLSLMHKFVGIQFFQTTLSILLHQVEYVQSIIDDYTLTPRATAHVPLFKLTQLQKDTPINEHDYQGLIGKLYYMTKTRLDIMFAALLLSWVMHGPQQFHLRSAQQVVYYLQKTSSLGLWFLREEGDHIQGFSDVDYAWDIDEYPLAPTYSPI